MDEPISRELFHLIEEGNVEQLSEFISRNESSSILQALLTKTLPNHDRKYDFEELEKQDAEELLGSNTV